MGTHVRNIPERVAAVSVGIVWGRKNYRDPAPEMLEPSELAVVIAERDGFELEVSERYTLDGDDLDLAVDHLLDLGLPIVGFNLLRFDWLSLGLRASVDPLLPVSIDLYSVLYGKVSDLVDAEGVSAFPKHGEYGVLNLNSLVGSNVGDYLEPRYESAGFTDAVEEAESAAALWNKFVSSERALIAGHAHPLDESDLDLLCSQSACYASPEEWRQMLRERPVPSAYRPRARHQVTSFPRVDQRYV